MYDANSLDMPVTCLDAPESNIQFGLQSCIDVKAWFNIPELECIKLATFSTEVGCP